jgi:hypothetical protein
MSPRKLIARKPEADILQYPTLIPRRRPLAAERIDSVPLQRRVLRGNVPRRQQTGLTLSLGNWADPSCAGIGTRIILALLLGRKGHSVVVVDRWPDLYPHDH